MEQGKRHRVAKQGLVAWMPGYVGQRRNAQIPTHTGSPH
jgi:hypothetical protein